LSLHALLALFLIGCGGLNPTASTTDGVPSVTTGANQKLDFVPDGIKAFCDEYSANPLAANAKYRDKVLQFSGKVTWMHAAPIKARVVALADEKAAGSGGHEIHCNFSNPADVANVKVDDRITVRGRYSGGFILEDCRILPN
jgi:hypothetical protein